MKNILIVFCLIALLPPVSMAQKTWKASDYKPESYRKVMVLAQLSNFTARRQLEDFTVKYLNDKGIVAIPAYSNMKQTDGISREQFMVIADSLQVDALLVYSLNGAVKRTEVTGTVSVGVGVGMYGGYAAASVPVSASTKQVADVKLSVYFYNRASLDEQWAWQLAGTLDGNTDKLANTFAKSTVKTMLNDGMFVKK